MINFWQGHQEAIITTLIGIISSIFFYYKAKWDGDKTANEYKLRNERAEKETQKIQSKLAETYAFVERNFHVTISQDTRLKDIDEKFSSRNAGAQMIGEINDEFKNLLIKNKLDEAENYLIGKKPFIKPASLYDYMDATLKFRQGRFGEAIKLLDAVTEADDGVMELDQVYAFKAVIYSDSLRDSERALFEWLEASNIKRDIHYEVSIAACYLNMKQHKLAKERLDAASKMEDYYPGLWLVYARYNQDMKNYDLALEQIETAYSLGVVTPGLFVAKALVQEAVTDVDGALESYRAAIKLDPNHRSAIYNLANLYIKQGNIRQAEIEFNYYRNIYPNELYVLGSYFYILSLTDRRKRVIEIGERLRIVENVAECHEAVYTLGLSYLMYDEIEKAEQCFKSILALYPDYAPTFTGLFMVNVNIKKRDLVLAELYCKKALEVDPTSLVDLNHKAILYIYKKEFDAAFKLFEQILALDPEHEFTKRNLSAIKEYHKAYQSEPDPEKREKLEFTLHFSSFSKSLSEKEYESFTK